jgi:hypothetical protein
MNASQNFDSKRGRPKGFVVPAFIETSKDQFVSYEDATREDLLAYAATHEEESKRLGKIAENFRAAAKSKPR